MQDWKKRIGCAFVFVLIAAAAVVQAQTTTSVIYSLPNTDGNAQWVELGTYNASQQGYDIDVQIVSSSGYSASISQDQVTYVQFKSSNAAAVNSTGFAGDSWWYQTGPNTQAPSQLEWVANAPGTAATAFTLYAYFGPFTGSGSYYAVEVPPGTSWTNIAAAVRSNPGPNSSTVLVAQNEFFTGSTASFAGNVGIGTSSPMGVLDVANGTTGGLVVSGANLDPRAGYSLTPLENSGKVLFGWNESGGAGETDLISNRGLGGGGGFSFYDYTNSGTLNFLAIFQGSGNVGIGTTSPGAKLEVDGNVKLTAGSGASITFADGTTQSTAWTGAVCGGDYAESVDVSGDRKHYEPGDVLVIDPNNPGKFLKSAEPYSTSVTGVYSTKPGVVGRRQTGPKTADEVPMAMIGIVPTKVSAENGPIHPGDLLVTSSTMGYAMKGTDRGRMLGAVIGKALGTLNSGKGVIEVVVTLQ